MLIHRLVQLIRYHAYSMPRRFSILTLLLTTAVIALSIALWQTSTKLAESMTDLQGLRSELGYLDVADPKMIQFNAVRTLKTRTWKWRIHVPDGEFNLSYGTQKNPDGSFFKMGHRFIEGPRTFTVSVNPIRSEDQRWKLECVSTHRDGGDQFALPMLDETHQQFLNEETGFSSFSYSESSKNTSTRTRDPNKDVTIMDITIKPTEKTNQPYESGIYIWLSPKE